MRRCAAELCLLVLFGFLYFVGLSHPALVDYDESSYAATARAMVESGHYLEPSYNGAPFFEKPPLVYWIQAAGLRLFGFGALGARFGNSVLAVATLLLMYRGARTALGARAAFASAAILGTSWVYVVLARITFTDITLTFWLVSTLFLFHAAHERDLRGRRSSWHFYLACLCSGMAVLAKGAIGILLPVAAVFVFLACQQRLRFLFHPTRLLIGSLLMCGVGFSWYLLLGLTTPGGFGFMKDLFLLHHVGRFSEPMQGHGGPFFFFVPVLLLGMFPWSLLTLPAVTRADLVRAAEPRRRLLHLFGLFAVITFLFFSASATKLPNYILPVLPAVALWVGDFLCSARASALFTTRRGRAALRGIVALTVLLGAAFAAAGPLMERVPVWLEDDARKVPPLAFPIDAGLVPFACATAFLVSALAVLRAWRRKDAARVAWALFAGSFAVQVLCATLALGRFENHFQRPLLELARQGAAMIPEDERLLLLGLRHCAGVVFDSERNTEYCTNRRTALNDKVNRDRPRIGITNRGLFEQFAEVSGLSRIAEDMGYVLFRGPTRIAPLLPAPDSGGS